MRFYKNPHLFKGEVYMVGCAGLTLIFSGGSPNLISGPFHLASDLAAPPIATVLESVFGTQGRSWRQSLAYKNGRQQGLHVWSPHKAPLGFSSCRRGSAYHSSLPGTVAPAHGEPGEQ